ncbi:cation diffusion facilitator family transporter [Hyphomicrobium sp. LHD-15]|uniref:cation diffusion facilitator family transporter n=1 Tax=Hyphomicrobium sp. LHD-15 TaxID=3072142 RepID=UPI00280F87FB|nr:cation diffusion facilitator family transporter [Hyphomicrobium sp. LHD-15]MDQ8700246.1 cation diffusion facilitator family transporter [Hyphomicrobium sp. LHD-15]
MTEARVTRTLHLIAVGSIAVALAVLGLKYAAYAVTGSVALYSDALESIVNLVAAGAALVAINVSARPADKNHQFGHHKAEYLSAVLEGALIVVAALLIIREAYDALLKPRDLSEFGFGMLLSLLATALNGAWSAFLINRGRAFRSPALVADGWHLLSDVLTSVGVVLGLVLGWATGLHILDPLIAIAVACYILWSGSKIAMASISGLLDEAADSDIQARIRDAIKRSGDGALEAHDVRTRQAGRALFIEFHLVVPGTMTVNAAHDICDRLEAALEAEIEGSEVVIHVEPEYKAKKHSKSAIRL